MPYQHGERLNIVDKTYNRLTVMRYLGKSKWLCKCSCGTLCRIDTGKLKNGHTKSCGCLMREHHKRIKGAPNGRHDQTRTAIDFLYQSYEQKARERGFCFELTLDQFENLTSKECFYCGDPPHKAYRRGNVDSIMYSGIDRVDNKVGYEPGNCVPCCKSCNCRKSWLTTEEFEASIRKKILEMSGVIKIYKHWLREEI